MTARGGRTQATSGSTSDTPTRVKRAWGRWPQVSAWVALIWSAGYALAGVAWSAGSSWYPFRQVSLDRASASLLEGTPAVVVGPAFTASGILGVVAAVILLRQGADARWHRAAIMVGCAWALAATTLIPDYTILAVLALWPVLALFAVVGVLGGGAQDGLGDILYWHRVHLFILFLGGLAWAGATLAALRRHRGGCVNCGRRPGDAANASPQRLARLTELGRRFVFLALLATLPYDVTRIAWFLGWPLGLTDELYRSLQDPPVLLTVGLVLGILSTAGAWLTHGLVATWGERFPGWVPRLGGRPVPVMLAVVPAALVALSLPPASIMFANPGINGGFDLANWGVWLPSMFWLLWGVGLGGAAWTYYLRRRGECWHCARASGASSARDNDAAGTSRSLPFGRYPPTPTTSSLDERQRGRRQALFGTCQDHHEPPTMS
jgi:hypothetical protein